MEALQIAQMLADLNDLQASQDQSASKNLVSANKTLDHKDQPSSAPSLHHRRSHTGDGRVMSPPAPGARSMTDKFGRLMFSPPLSRANSGNNTSLPTTPRGESFPEPDIDKASTLLSLYEIRAKLKEQDNSSLMKAREKINALAAKQQAQTGADKKSPTPTSTPSQRDPNSKRMNYPKQA